MWQNGGFPVASQFPQEGAILYVSGMVVPKNAPNKAAALKYMNALLEPSAQQGFAAQMGYLPTVTNAPLTGKVAEQLASRSPCRSWCSRIMRSPPRSSHRSTMVAEEHPA